MAGHATAKTIDNAASNAVERMGYSNRFNEYRHRIMPT
jgi:hypothetical protein